MYSKLRTLRKKKSKTSFKFFTITKIILFAFTFIVPVTLLSQTPVTIKIKEIADSIENYRTRKLESLANDSINERYFSKGGYDRFFDNYFTQIKYERESFTEGNSAALKIDDKTTRLNLTLSKKTQNTIFSIGTALNVADKSGVIFSDNKPTAGTEFSGGMSFLIPQWRFLSFKGPDMLNNYRKRRFVADSIWLIHTKKNPAYGKLLESKINDLELLYRRYDSILANPGKANVALYGDSLIQVIDKKMKARQELELLDNGLTTAADFAKEISSAGDKTEVNKELATDGITSFRMLWITTGLNYRRDNYATYDSLLVFSKRTGEKPFDKWTLNLTLNFFWQRTSSWIAFRNSKFINSIYANISYSYVHTNNFEKLTEEGLSINRVRTQNDTIYEFSAQKKIRDISGKSFNSGWIHRPAIVTTMMLGKKQFIGINLLASADFENKRRTVFNSRAGVLFRFKDSENEKSLINFELFFSFKDMSDIKKSGKSVWQNKELGISANVPFQKVFFR